MIYHFMFHPEWEDGCSSCTAGTDELSRGFIEHLRVRDTSYALVSRAPLAKLQRWKARKGWDLPWSHRPRTAREVGAARRPQRVGQVCHSRLHIVSSVDRRSATVVDLNSS
jgi:predicted dithiol-disulfide oxidoreductase (DUF899 family)